MAQKIIIDGRIVITGKKGKGHMGMGNPVDITNAIETVVHNNPSLAGNPYTFENGLYAATTPTGTNVKLGGVLVENTKIDGDTLYDIEFEKLNNFNVNAIESYIETETGLQLVSVSPTTGEKALINIENNAFIFESRDTSNVTSIYQLPSQEQPAEGDIMVINGNNKAVFTPLERDVQAEDIVTIIIGSISHIYLPFNTGDWTLKRVTMWSFGTTTGDEIEFIIRDSAGVAVTSPKSITLTEASSSGAGGAGIGYTEDSVFIHTGEPDAYQLEITDLTTDIPHSVTKVTLTFIKTF